MDIPAAHNQERQGDLIDSPEESVLYLVQDRALPPAPEQGLAPSLDRGRLQAYLAMVLADVVILLGCFALALQLYPNTLLTNDTMLAAYLLLPLFQTIAFHNATYSRSSLTQWRGASLRAIAALLISAALLNFFAFFAKMNAEFSRMAFASGMVGTAALMVLFRIGFARWCSGRWGASPINILVIDAGGAKVTLPNAYRINAHEHGLRPDVADPDALDRLSKYLSNMDQVIVSCPQNERKRWANVLKGSGIHGEVVSTYVRDLGALGVLHHEDAGFSTILVSNGHLGLRARATKRLFDVTLSLVALIVLSPVLLLAVLAIKLEDGGSLLFSQKRMGRRNRFFTIHKLRTMREEDADPSGARSTSKDDDRVTRVGRILRATSIDELPQLFNVLRGEMSLVGPRPHALGSQAGEKLFWQVDRRYWQRHGLRPGITGLAQVRGYRGATDTEEDLSNRLQADLEYMSGWSLWRDVKIVLSTLRVVIHQRAF